MLRVRIDRICNEFEKLIQQGTRPKIETYLPQLPATHREVLLEELVGLELDYRVKSGESFTSEEYTLRFPEHALTVAKLVADTQQRKPKAGKVKPTSLSPSASPNGNDDFSDSTHRSQPNQNTIRIGPYEIIAPCGRGGMGVVYKAWHSLFRQFRAIKVLPREFDKDDLSRFAVEIEAAGRLNHPNVVRAFEANTEQDVLYLVMEYVDGITLDHLIKHHQYIPMGLACELIRQAAEGLQHAHENFMVHRDIKPSNLMVNQEGQVKLLDFGLARLHAEQQASRLTQHGSVMGTLDFMAPEQWVDPMAATIQADIYSLGCTLYYLVTGTPPYGGEDYSHWLKKQEAHREHPVPKLESEHSKDLQPIIDRMMAKDCKNRFALPSEVVEALTSLADTSEILKYAQTQTPELASSKISNTPIPTIQVSSTDMLDDGPMAQLADRVSPEDSDVNSRSKTLKPSHSHPDIDTEQTTLQKLPPPAKSRFTSRTWQVGIAVLAVMLLCGAWYLFRPIKNPELAEQLGALPGLNGGLKGDWWFAEMPWYGPGVRKAVMEAVHRGEDQIAGIPISTLEERLSGADTELLQHDLRLIAEEIHSRLPEREQTWSRQIMLLKHSMPDYDRTLLNILPNEFRSEALLEAEELEAASPTELHMVANILHWVSESNKNFDLKTKQLYNTTIATYKEDPSDPVKQALLAVALADYSRFLAARKEYNESVRLGEEAGKLVPNAMLFHVSLRCDMADQYRKFHGDSIKALDQLTGRQNSAKSWAKRMQLAEDHPLQAEMLERSAWINIDGWQFPEAIQNFQQATRIRQVNQKLKNTFAWRPILLNQQGSAMAVHYLGQDHPNPDNLGSLKLYANLIKSIEKPDGDLEGTQEERRDRLPNTYERFADVYLFDGSYKDAQVALGQGITSAKLLGFEDSSTLWFYLTRLYYKRSLALSLAIREKQIPEPKPQETTLNPSYWIAQAAGLEKKFQSQLAEDTKKFQNQSSVFELEKNAALAMLAGNTDEKAWTALKEVVSKAETDKLTPPKLEVLLLCIQLLFESENSLPEELDQNLLARRLLQFTGKARQGDSRIRTVYLKRVFESAINGIGPASESIEVKETLVELKAAIALQ